MSLLQDMRTRGGATHVDLIVTDGHDGLLAAVSELFSATPRQRCLVHKQRNVLNAIPRRGREMVLTDLKGIWKSEKKDALINLNAFLLLSCFHGCYSSLRTLVDASPLHHPALLSWSVCSLLTFNIKSKNMVHLEKRLF
ncbi:MAG: hypothetical protein PVS3B3_05550 [Ktedonobacteraceae bacterium]